MKIQWETAALWPSLRLCSWCLEWLSNCINTNVSLNCCGLAGWRECVGVKAQFRNHESLVRKLLEDAREPQYRGYCIGKQVCPQWVLLVRINKAIVQVFFKCCCTLNLNYDVFSSSVWSLLQGEWEIISFYTSIVIRFFISQRKPIPTQSNSCERTLADKVIVMPSDPPLLYSAESCKPQSPGKRLSMSRGIKQLFQSATKFVRLLQR